MHKGAFDFQIDRSKPLAEEAARAVDVIYTAGLMFRGGSLGPGGNNVAADNAANAFSANDLAVLNAMDDSPLNPVLASIIAVRQKYSAPDVGAGTGRVMLHIIYSDAQTLKELGWKPSSEPLKIGGGPALRP